MKKTYEKPSIEVNLFEVEEIMLTSANGSDIKDIFDWGNIFN